MLVVERASFPSDTLSTHQVQLPGIARLKRWGLLDRIIASGPPVTRHVRVDPGQILLGGHYPTFQGVDRLYSPRRTVLDKILVDAAREAGTEVRERYIVEEFLLQGGSVTGIRGREKGGVCLTEKAPLVVGADGKRFCSKKCWRQDYYERKEKDRRKAERERSALLRKAQRLFVRPPKKG